MRGLLSMAECIDAVRGALIDLAGGRGIQPLRPVMWLPERVGALGVMPGYLPSIGVMGIKTVSVFPGNAGTEHDAGKPRVPSICTMQVRHAPMGFMSGSLQSCEM